jgi:hypothetical protein
MVTGAAPSSSSASLGPAGFIDTSPFLVLFPLLMRPSRARVLAPRFGKTMSQGCLETPLRTCVAACCALLDGDTDRFDSPASKRESFYSRSLNPSGTPVIVRATEGGEIKMKRAILFALMLVTVLAPLAGVAHADLKSDQAIPQAP